MPVKKTSITQKCRDLAVGESTYAEFDTLKQANNATKRLHLAERLPKEMKSFKFECETFTAIARVSEKIIFINKVTRIK